MSGLDLIKRVAAAALNEIESLVAEWLPGGKREGAEWACADLSGNPGSSCKVNLHTGVWCDFAAGDKGGDLVSLYAEIFTGGDQMKAALQLAERLGINTQTDRPAESKTISKKAKTPWVPVVPVPDDAPPPPAAHYSRGKPTHQWHYKNAAQQLLGVVCRFTTSDGGKDVVPYVWARNSETGATEWRCQQWLEPRPLYGLDRFDAAAKLLVLVEGEKKVDAGYDVLAGRVNFASWSGGCKAYTKADWSSLSVENVIIWPDADEVGRKAADGIAKILTKLGKKVRVVRVPDDKPPAWDLADAVQIDGWHAGAVMAFIKSNLGETVRDVAESDATISPPESAGAGHDSAGGINWAQALYRTDKGMAKDVWMNVLHVLMLHEDWQGVLGYDEFANRIVARKQTPWRKTGEWQDGDDNELSLWLASKCNLLIKQPGTVALGVVAAAKRNAYNPVREWVEAQQWDKTPRLRYWMHECCGVRDSEYSALIGTLFMRGVVKRALQPGCKMDSALILIGAQGAGKSTVWRTLGGDWFADTPFKPGDKDSYMMVQGALIYELCELEQFNKAETTAIKAFVTSTTDRYRLPYGRSISNFPRQCVFGGTTNNFEIFKDMTGNRRFWPAEVDERGDGINIAKLSEWRAQLFAEALHDIRAGERIYPTQLEAFRLIEPECRKYEVADAWSDAIEAYLEANTITQLTVGEILSEVLKLSLRDLQSPRGAETRVGQIMGRLGWRKKRVELAGVRKWVYQRPAQALSRDAALTAQQDENMADDRLPI